MFNTFDFLIIFVAFAGNEDDIIGSGMFRLAGTVLTYGVVSAVIFGAIRYLLFGGAL